MDVADKQRSKIVFVDRGYRGPMPRSGEEWVCREVRDTKPEDPRRGALIVRPVEPAQIHEVWKVLDSRERIGSVAAPLLVFQQSFGLVDQSGSVRKFSWLQLEAARECPAAIMAEARRRAEAFRLALEHTVQRIAWPDQVSTTPCQSWQQVDGQDFKTDSRLEIRPDGLYWRHQLVHPVSADGPSVRLVEFTTPAEGWCLKSRADLEALVRLLGRPDVASLRLGYQRNDPSTAYVRWADFQVDLEVSVLFGGPYDLQLGAVREGWVEAQVSCPGLDVSFQVQGLTFQEERQTYVWRDGAGSWKLSDRQLGERSAERLRPAVMPVVVSHGIQKYFTESQRAWLLERVPRWSARDHLYFFRRAVCDSPAVVALREEANELSEISRSKPVRARVESWLVTEHDESPDGRRIRESRTVYELRVQYADREVGMPVPEVWHEDLPRDQKLERIHQLLVERLRTRQAKIWCALRTILEREAEYTAERWYPEPESRVDAAAWQALEADIARLLSECPENAQ